jgi:two-component system nitrogen regulation response regulator GlnG
VSVSPDSTRTTPRGAGKRGPARVPALSVLWHPRLERVGERALLVDELRGKQHEIQRFAPLFGAPGGPVREPLQDLSVSRQPLQILRERDGVVLRFDQAGKLRVDGQALVGTHQLPDAALERGVVIELSSHVALVLHWVASVRAETDFGLVGESDCLHAIRRQLGRVAPHRVPVLLLGESGTGKELLARAIHDHGSRRDEPFIAVNMAAIPAGTAADALFGHARGAFTGAAASAPGYFVQADRGTLFLDEIGATPPEVQAALLRVLETGEVQALGVGRPRAVDVRVVAATDADLDAAVAAGRFSLPLLHRVRGYELRMPPLRERREDIGRLLRHFLEQEHGGPPGLAAAPEAEPWLAASLVAELALRPLPGNVRELRQLARRLVIDWGDAAQVGLDTLLPSRAALAPPAGAAADAAQRARSTPSEAELLQALEQSEWRPSRAALLLGISRTRVYGLINRSPSLATAAALRPELIREQLVACAGDVDRAARALRVSRHGLLLRLRGVGPGSNSSETEA